MPDPADPPPPSRMSRIAFVERFGGVFEHSPWVAERAFERGLRPEHDTAAGLHARMAEALRAAGREEQLALIRAHPDLAGRLGLAGALTAMSRAEQAGAGLNQCTPEELSRFQALNDAYQARFGFPFIMAVKGRTRAEILQAFERRIGHEPEQEFETARREIERIALFRLQGLLEPSG